MIRFALCLSIAIVSTTASAQFKCDTCGAVINTQWWQGPCPNCNNHTVRRIAPTPAPAPAPTPFPSPVPTPGAPDSSGVRLGVNIYNAGSRVIVQSVLPNTPAQGKLFPNDQIVKGAFRDALTGRVIKVMITSPADMTRLKTLAGAGTKVALQVFRPTTGSRNFFVTFATPGIVSTQAQTYSVVVNGHTETRVREVSESGQDGATASAMVVEDTTGAAAAMLDDNSFQGGTPVGPAPGVPPAVMPTQPTFGGDSADDLLGG
jgi:predicted RNA-binding Zn-ribbon protein involved in translation (DUF1610 family)